jgi:hypothetical protein
LDGASLLASRLQSNTKLQLLRIDNCELPIQILTGAAPAA